MTQIYASNVVVKLDSSFDASFKVISLFQLSIFSKSVKKFHVYIVASSKRN